MGFGGEAARNRIETIRQYETHIGNKELPISSYFYG